MIRRRSPQSVPTLNATSTADISFMLLIFFLVATSMDADLGLKRQLPPADDAQQQVQVDVNKDLLLALELSADGTLAANGQPLPMADLRHVAADFIGEVGPRHLITLNAHPEASYDCYFLLQNQLSLAYADARNQRALQQFHQPMAQCSADQQADINGQLPWRIAESYPKEEGGQP